MGETLRGCLEFNINIFHEYALNSLKTLIDAGGDDSQACNKIYEILSIAPNNQFNNVIMVWKSALDASEKTIDKTNFLIKARDEYGSTK